MSNPYEKVRKFERLVYGGVNNPTMPSTSDGDSDVLGVYIIDFATKKVKFFRSIEEADDYLSE